MEAYKVIEIKKSVFESNDREAEKLRAELKAEKTFLVNLMSSPGSGKTTTLRGIIGRLQQEMRIGVMEADIDSDVDAKTIAETGVRAIQLHTGGMCHLDAGMTRQGVENLGTADLDLVFLENVGNLVCPAEFDTGAAKNIGSKNLLIVMYSNTTLVKVKLRSIQKLELVNVQFKYNTC